MADEEHVAILEKGAEGWNAWRRENPKARPDLSYADLSSPNLSYTDLSSANLSGAFIRHAYLRYADLSGAYLVSTDLSYADLSYADLTASTFGLTKLAGLDLREANGLDMVYHQHLSDISTNVLSMSKGKIPEVFLKGCGLADWEIAMAKLHDPTLSSEEIIDITYEVARIKAESPIQVNPIFISYSHKDTTFVESLEQLLDSKRVRYWRDVHDLKARRLEIQIDRAIRHNPTVLMVLSEHSVESDWVEWEASKARELEREYRKEKTPRDVLCPIALDDSWKDSDWGGPLRRQIEKYNILDFSEWEDGARMDVAFQELIDGLGLFYK